MVTLQDVLNGFSGKVSWEAPNTKFKIGVSFGEGNSRYGGHIRPRNRDDRDHRDRDDRHRQIDRCSCGQNNFPWNQNQCQAYLAIPYNPTMNCGYGMTQPYMPFAASGTLPYIGNYGYNNGMTQQPWNTNSGFNVNSLFPNMNPTAMPQEWVQNAAFEAGRQQGRIEQYTNSLTAVQQTAPYAYGYGYNPYS